MLDVPQSCGENMGEGKNLGVTAQHLVSACQILPRCQTGQKRSFRGAQKVREHSQILGQVCPKHSKSGLMMRFCLGTALLRTPAMSTAQKMTRSNLGLEHARHVSLSS